LHENTFKILVTYLDELKVTENSGPSWIMSLLRQPFISGVVDNPDQ